MGLLFPGLPSQLKAEIYPDYGANGQHQAEDHIVQPSEALQTRPQLLHVHFTGTFPLFHSTHKHQTKKKYGENWRKVRKAHRSHRSEARIRGDWWVSVRISDFRSQMEVQLCCCHTVKPPPPPTIIVLYFY